MSRFRNSSRSRRRNRRWGCKKRLPKQTLVLFPYFHQPFHRNAENLRHIQQQTDRWLADGSFHALQMIARIARHLGKLILRQPLFFAVPHDIQPELDVILIVLILDAPPCCLYFTRDAYSIRRYILRKYADYVVFWRKSW